MWVLGICESLALFFFEHGVEFVGEVGEHVADVVEHVDGLGALVVLVVGRVRRGLDVGARRQPRQPQAAAPVLHRVRPPAYLPAVLLYGPSVFIRKWNAIRFSAGA